MAASLNFFDLLMLVGKYQMKPKLPFVIGSEGAGEIIEVGKGVEHLQVGQHVIFMNIGAMAEEIVLSAFNCIIKPPTLSFEQA